MPVLHRLTLLLSISTIFVMGLVMIFNTSSAEVLDHDLAKSTHQALFKQILYGISGLVLAGIMWVVGFRRLIELSPYLLVVFCVLLALTLVPGIGREVNGSRRWIGIAGFSFQTSEFVKYIVPAFMINRLLPIDPSQLSLKGFLTLVVILAVPILLILVEPNNGTAGVVGLTVLVVCIVSRIPMKFWAIPLLVLAVIGTLSAYHLPYVSARIHSYLHPELDLRGKGHQPYQAKIAAGSGQLTGLGPGNSLQKLSYLPEAQNDYIAAIFAEEFGFIGVTVLVFLYMLIGYIGFSIAYHSPSREGYYLAAIVVFLICFQAFMNLGVVSGLLPSTGLNLPFFSQGGSSLMANMMGFGLLLNIAYENVETEQKSCKRSIAPYIRAQKD